MPMIRVPFMRQTPGRPSTRAPQERRRHPKAKIVTDDVTLVLPFAPTDATHDGLAGTWSQLPRPGRKPLTVLTGDGLRSCQFDVLLAHPDAQKSVEPLIAKLRKIARSGAEVTVSRSGLEHGIRWNLTGLSVATQALQHGTNAVTRATASLTFTESVDPVVHAGPMTGGKKKHGGKGAPVGKGHHGGGGGGGARRYTVRAGDTLSAIALKFYGDPNDWHRIAKANKIRDPRKLKVGTRLTIPADKD